MLYFPYKSLNINILRPSFIKQQTFYLMAINVPLVFNILKLIEKSVKNNPKIHFSADKPYPSKTNNPLLLFRFWKLSLRQKFFHPGLNISRDRVQCAFLFHTNSHYIQVNPFYDKMGPEKKICK